MKATVLYFDPDNSVRCAYSPNHAFLGQGRLSDLAIRLFGRERIMADTATGNRTTRIFYAWQDDLPQKYNRNAIRKALQIAAAELEAEFSDDETEPLKIDVDEATRGIPGSPNIPREILGKIQRADIFVADVSSINAKQIDEAKKTPNPNVVFELGYAVAQLGWNRVILLVNEVHGSVKKLPFDFDRHRASVFQLAENIGSDKDLKSLLHDAIGLILKERPPRPNSFNLAETKRARDLATVRLFLGFLHWPTLDEHINTGPKFLQIASANFFDAVNELVHSSTFHVYDDDLRAAVFTLVQEWAESMKFDHYLPMKHSRAYVFKFSDHPKQFLKEQEDFNYMEKARINLRKAADELLNVIRTKFPEVDIEAESQSAAAAYDAEMERIGKMFDDATNGTKSQSTHVKPQVGKAKEIKSKKSTQ